MPRPNWFFAFPLDGAFVETLPELPVGFRRYHPDDVHLTLAFLGGCGEAGAERALAVLDELLPQSQQPPIAVSLGHIAAMGPKGRYSALSALLERGRAETEAFMAQFCDPLLLAATGRRERRKPKAHVTLARPRHRATDAQREAGRAWAERVELGAVEAVLDRIVLYTWSENRAERLFRRVTERRLPG
jgi:RNA 2',3'-cyclic 3'-phosphodiesterase